MKLGIRSSDLWKDASGRIHNKFRRNSLDLIFDALIKNNILDVNSIVSFKKELKDFLFGYYISNSQFSFKSFIESKFNDDKIFVILDSINYVFSSFDVNTIIEFILEE
ncbi:hypothetical protein [Carp edema virus]|nr:hypothetical protein [Carp edema virus]